MALCQVERATITGVITDKSNANIDQATVKVVEEATNQTTMVKTDSAGAFTVGNLTPGSYSITISKQGFAQHVIRNYGAGWPARPLGRGARSRRGN